MSIRRIVAAAIMAVAVLPFVIVPVAHATAIDATCTITVGGKRGYYLCQYSPTSMSYDGRHHVFVVGTDGAVWHIWDTTRSARYGDGPYSSWTSLGGVATSNVVAYQYNAAGAIALGVLVRGTTNGNRDLYCKFYNVPPNNGRWSPSMTGWVRGNANYCPP